MSDPSLLVDLGRYPLGEAESAAYRDSVDEARHQLRDWGAAEMPGFVSLTGVAELVRDAERARWRRCSWSRRYG